MTGRGLGFALALVAAAAISVPAAGAADPPDAGLQNFRCWRASSPLERIVGVTAVMRPVAGTQRMQLKFQLLERLAGARRFHQVRGGDLGRWRHPDPASFGSNPNDVWMVKKPVSNLAAPAVYRFRVRFRWLDASGGVIEAQTAVSPRCAQSR